MRTCAPRHSPPPKNIRRRRTRIRGSTKLEIELAKAEIFKPETLPALQAQKEALWKERREILSGLGISEAQLVPRYRCKKCSDTGFLPDGTACDCYRPEAENARPSAG